MAHWKDLLRADPTDWLLEETDPSVRYFTLKDLLDRPEEDDLVRQAKREILQNGIVREILTRQQDPLYLKSYPDFYTDKYRGLVWQTIVLAELGADGGDQQIREQCEYLLDHSQENTDGGFSMHASAKSGGGRLLEVIPCLSGNMVWSLIRLGFEDDPRIQKGIGWLVRFMRFNDGVEQDPQVSPYNYYEMCWGRHTCHMGAVKALKALSAVPEEKRSPEVRDTIDRAVEFLLIHNIYKRSHDLPKISRPGWLKFGFPLMYQTDALEILDILTGLGVKDGRMDEALEMVLSKQDDKGKWRAENTTASSQLLVPFGQKGAPDKWITLRAARVIKRGFQGG